MARPDDASAVAAPISPSFETLCHRHGELLEAQAAGALDTEATDAFIADAAGAGVQIESVTDRDAIRSMINYWTATLARLPRETAERAEACAALSQAERPMLASFDASQSPDLDESRNPFVGLAAFDVGQSDVFFGRDGVVADLLELVLANPIVVVSGASGTGKSSLVRAGLTAALRADPSRADWTIGIAPPGRDPIASLVAAFAPQDTNSVDWVEAARARLDADPAEAGVLAAQRIGEGGLLLVVDQLEELFSLCPPEDRDRAATALGAIAALPRAHVVLTLRDEYLEGERAHRVLPGLDLASAKEFRIPPLDASEIRAAIVEPAARAGLVFQDGLIDRIVAEVGTDPAALPLLQYALLRMWQERQGNRITLAVYEKVGGPATALSKAAQEIYDGFLPQARENARIIFQQLVRPSLLYEFVRDRVSRLELQRLLPGDSIRAVVRPFVQAGLIVVTLGSDRAQDRIEIAHEALIRNWDLLRRWAGDVRDRERLFLEIDTQAQRWEESGHSPGHLLFLKALKSAEQAQKQYMSRARVDPVANARVERFLTASLRTQRRLLGLAGGVLLIALILVASLFWQSSSNRAEVSKLVRGANAVIAEEAASGAQAVEGSRGRDAGRQFIQMLLTRGTIQPDELPTAFSDMTPIAANLSTDRWQIPFDDDFLRIGESILPTLASPATIRLDLPNLRAFYDPQTGTPRLIVSQSDRSAAPWRGSPNALYRWQDLPGQADEAALAANGLALARLISQREVGWGPQGENAARSVNLLPLMVPSRLRNGERALANWPRVTAGLRAGHNPKASRVLYFTGAVPGPDRNAPPIRLWKVAVSVKDGNVVADALMLPGAGENGRASLDMISAASGIDFSRLKAMLASNPGDTPSDSAAAPVTRAQVPARVHIQFRNVPEELVTGIRLALAAEGLRTPPVERVDSCIPAQVRYYHPEDAGAAERAAAIATAAFKEAGSGVGSVKVSQFPLARYPNVPRGDLELWFCGSTRP